MKQTKQVECDKEAYLNLWLTRSQHWLSHGNFKRSILALKKALKIAPDDVKIINNLSLLFSQTSQHSKALTLIDRAICHNPHYLNAYCSKAIALMGGFRFEEALDTIDYAIQLNSCFDKAMSLRGQILVRIKKYDEAIQAFESAIKLNPLNEANYLELGFVLFELSQLQKAIFVFKHALQINPHNSKSLVNLSTCYIESGQLDLAIDSINHALSITPDCIDAQWNKAIVNLLQGDYARGLESFASRKLKQDTQHHYRQLNPPLLKDIKSLDAEKTLYLYPEQGLGDFIQMLRYIKPLEELGCQIILETPPELIAITQMLVNANTQLVNGIPEEKAYDFQCPIMDLMAIFLNHNLYQSQQLPYIRVTREKINHWSQQLGPKTKPRIGIAWSSATQFRYDKQRSLKFSEFKACLPENMFDVICLQKVIKDEDKTEFEAHGKISFFGNTFNDFSDTAALIECLDVVITTCTSIAHLSAAMNKPTWILLKHTPDWRWQMNQATTPWYPAMRLYRQAVPYDWSSVLVQIRNDLVMQIQNIKFFDGSRH